jgi:FMN-dependent NADH-azoreductase
MSRVLIIESSARQQDSVSRQLTQTFINQWKPRTPTIRSPCVTWP